MKVYLIAGEASGDIIGSSLMIGLKKLYKEVKFFGVGGPLMQSEGLVSLFPMSDLSVMGLAEILPKLFDLIKRKNQTVRNVLELCPEVLITIDSPDFSLRVARKVRKKSKVKIIHYVAPTVWAWRPKRAIKMSSYVNHVLALFPFEKKLMEVGGMTCDFVSHPVIDYKLASKEEVFLFRNEFNLLDKRIILVLPGSRVSEVNRLTKIFKYSLLPILSKYPDLRVVIPTTENVYKLVKELTVSWQVQPIILPPENAYASDNIFFKRSAFMAADVALAASGTVSLELAANSVPMVVAYDMNFFSRFLMKFFLKTDSVTLVNLISNSRTVPEFLGSKCRPEYITKAVMDLIGSSEGSQKQLESQRNAISLLNQGNNTQGTIAALAVYNYLKNS